MPHMSSNTCHVSPLGQCSSGPRTVLSSLGTILALLILKLSQPHL